MEKFCDKATIQTEKIEDLDKSIKEKFEKAKVFFLEAKSTKFDQFVQYFYDFAEAGAAILKELKESSSLFRAPYD